MPIAPPVYRDIPAEMTQHPNWLIYKSHFDGKKNTKIPCNKSGSPQSFYVLSDYETAKQAQEDNPGIIAGIGYGMNKGETKIIGVDFDHVVNKETGEILPEVVSILDELDSYTEYSISGDGLHTFVISRKDDLPSKARIANAFGEGTGLEFFKSSCYITVSGKRVNTYGTTVKSVKDSVLNRIYKKYQKKEDKLRVAAVKSTTATELFGDVKVFVTQLEKSEVAVQSTKKLSDGSWKIKLERCPWGGGANIEAGTHDDGPDDAVIFFREGCIPVFYCFHTTCSDRHWDDFCRKYPSIPSGNFIDRYNSEFCVVQHGSLTLVARRNGDVLGTAKKFATFHEAQSFDKIEIGQDSLYMSRLWVESKHAARFPGGFVFKPNGDATPDCVNLWRGFAIEPSENGSCGLFYKHWREVFCNGDDAIYNWTRMWFADILQNPGSEPCGSAIIAKGEQGIGKSIIADVFGKLIGPHAYCEVSKVESLFAKHNADVATSVLINGAEITFAGDKSRHNMLKGAVTAKQNRLEAKFKDAIQIPCINRYFITTNADEAIPAERTERRFLVLDVPSTHLGDRAYFDAIWNEMKHCGGYERLMYDMLAIKVDRTALRHPPATDALRHEKEAAMDAIARFLSDCVEREELPGGIDEVVAGEDVVSWPSVTCKRSLYDAFCDYYSNHGYHRPSMPSHGVFVRKVLKMNIGIDNRTKNHSEKCFSVEPLDEVTKRLRKWVHGA